MSTQNVVKATQKNTNNFYFHRHSFDLFIICHIKVRDILKFYIFILQRYNIKTVFRECNSSKFGYKYIDTYFRCINSKYHT